MRKVNKVFKIGISKKNGEKINDINEIAAFVLSDRAFQDGSN